MAHFGKGKTEKVFYHIGHHETSHDYFFPPDKLHQIDPFIPMFDYYPSYFIWTKNYTHLFSIFDSTVLQCKQKVDVGIYIPDARFYFILSSSENPETVFEFNDYLHRHPQVAILQKVDTLNSGRIKYKIYGYNFFNQVNGLGNVVINHVWTEESKIFNAKQVFTDTMDMQGKFLTVGSNRGSYAIPILEYFTSFHHRSKLLYEFT